MTLSVQYYEKIGITYTSLNSAFTNDKFGVVLLFSTGIVSVMSSSNDCQEYYKY